MNDLKEKTMNDLIDFYIENYLSNHRPKRKTPLVILKQKIWLSWLKQHEEYSLERLAKSLYPNEEKEHRTIKRWKNLETFISPTSAKRIHENLPGAADILVQPLFDLLEPDLTLEKLKEIERLHVKSTHKRYYWFFPDDKSEFTISLRSIDELLSKNDEWGFFALVFLLRKSEFDKEPENHFYYMRDVYRAFPSIARKPGYKEYWEQLLEKVVIIAHRIPTTPWLVRPNINEMANQISSTHHNAVEYETAFPVKVEIPRPLPPYDETEFPKNSIFDLAKEETHNN